MLTNHLVCKALHHFLHGRSVVAQLWKHDLVMVGVQYRHKCSVVINWGIEPRLEDVGIINIYATICRYKRVDALHAFIDREAISGYWQHGLSSVVMVLSLCMHLVGLIVVDHGSWASKLPLWVPICCLFCLHSIFGVVLLVHWSLKT